MGRWWINQNPDALRIPEDANLGLTVHSYDPWSFAGDHPSSTSFSDDDAADAEAQQGRLADWAKEKGIQQVMLGEFGTTVQQPNRGDRLKYYKANAEACAKHDQGYAIWDDNGWWQVLNRDTRTWDEDILAQLASPLTLV
jgi:aryl-phospho-beta-D-glucosidase BglC (GH1 family)